MPTKSWKNHPKKLHNYGSFFFSASQTALNRPELHFRFINSFIQPSLVASLPPTHPPKDHPTDKKLFVMQLFLKFRYSEKAKKFEKFSHFVLMLLSNIIVAFLQYLNLQHFLKILTLLWPIFTNLHQIEPIKFIKLAQI